MQNLSIKQKTYGLFGILILATTIASGMIFASLNKAGEDADITNALGRQRMLSQAMGKTALGNAMAKSRKKTIERNVSQLDRYMTNMRANYTKYVIVPMKKAGIQISMEPETLKHPGVPFPATYTRIVNSAFAKNQDFQIDILSKDPVNADKTLKTDLDKAAWEALEKDPKQVVSRVYEEDGKLYIGLYTADIATIKPCASCHAAIKGRKFRIGEMLGIRSFRLLYSSDVGMGKSELNAKLDEYNRLKKIFEQTLNAMQNGGEYPTDLMGRNMNMVPAIDAPEAQNKIKEVQAKFNSLNAQVKNLEIAEVNSLPYRMAQQKILSGSNELRSASNDLVNLYTQIANRNQTRIRWAVIVNLVVVLIILFGMGVYLTRAVVNPMIKLAGVMEGVAQGNFVQDKLPVHSSDEVGKLAQTYNTMLDTMRDVVNQSEDIAAGNLSKQYEMKGDLAHAFEKMTQELRDKQAADEKFKAMADDLQKKVDHLLVVVSAAAKGDLTRKIPAMGKDAIGQMSGGLQVFFKRLSESMAAITQTANNLARSAKEISSAVSDQASVAQQNASSVTEISSTVEELAASSSQVAENANAVAEISSNALRETERGMEAMENLKSKMDLISEDNQASIKEIVDLGKRSNEIGKVMEIINNIADQTKLIAFNAAIEASSAGEAGKRFGVVAVEIRRLADNVMESTGDIQIKIEEIQQAINRLVVASETGSKRIHEGAELTGQTIEELERLVDGSKSAADSAQQISLSTGQQKTATDQVLTALKEIVNGSRQSSTAIRQTSSVTSKLSEMSNDLKNMVSKFKIS